MASLAYRQHCLSHECALSPILTAEFPSVLWCCWLGGRKGIPPVKNEWWGAGMVICLGRGADLHMAQLIALPLTVSCSRKSRLVLVLPFWYQLTPESHKTVIVVVVVVVVLTAEWCNSRNAMQWGLNAQCSDPTNTLHFWHVQLE